MEIDPNLIAYTFLDSDGGEAQAISYAKLGSSAQRLGQRLSALAAPGQPVLLVFTSGAEFLVSFFACLYVGAIAVPLPVPGKRQVGRLNSILKDSGSKLLLTTPQIAESLGRATLDTLATRGVAIECVELVETPLLSPWSTRDISPATVAFLQYTSGSTSEPKGVMVTHGNLMHNLSAIARAAKRTRADMGVSWLPHFHDMGLIDGLLSPFFSGYPTVNMAPEAFVQQPILWLRAITCYRGTTSGGPNFAYEHCLRRIDKASLDELDLSSWRLAYNGAEPISAKTLSRFSDFFAPCGYRKTSFLPCYGLAENTLSVAISDVDSDPITFSVDAGLLAEGRVAPATEDGKAALFVACGPAVEGVVVAIADPKTGERCPPRKVGEIWVKGPSVALGYWGRDQESDAVFRCRLSGDDGPFLRTGDLGFLADDQLYITGRLKDLIVIRGQNIYPQDIEATVAQAHPLWQGTQAAAFSIDHDGEECLVVVQEVAPRFRGTCTNEMVEMVRRKIAEAHQITVHAVVFVKHGGIPCTSSGKLQRRLCRKKFIDGELPALMIWRNDDQDTRENVEFDPPEALRLALVGKAPELASLLRTFLYERTASLLGVSVDVLAPDKPLSAFGFDSVKAMALASGMTHAIGHLVSPQAVYDHPTIDALCSYLVQLASGRGMPDGPEDVYSQRAAQAIDDVLAEVEGLSDSEVARLLVENN